MKAIIVDTATSAIDEEWRLEMLDWARSLGVETSRATSAFVLLESGGGWTAHFSLKRLKQSGHSFVDHSTGRIAVDYGCFRAPVAADSWPRWFGLPIELPEIPAAHLLNILSAADDAAAALKAASFHKNPKVDA